MQRYYSNIYWHFVGSPKLDWHKISKPSEIVNYPGKVDKTIEECCDIVIKILDSNKLLARCTELIDPVSNIETSQFCCVTDIPIKDLLTHIPFYGRVAIGFRANAIHETFLPVFYMPKELLPKKEITQENKHIKQIIGDAMSGGTGFDNQIINKYLPLLNQKLLVVNPDLKNYPLMNYIKLTQFSENPEDSFYREREWRCIGDFTFANENVACIVAPQVQLNEIRDWVIKKNYSEKISFLSQEVLEKA